MNTAIRYYSRSGNTKKLAKAIADAAGTTSKTTDEPLIEPVDILFLGGAIYAGNIDRHLKDFASSLTSDQVKKVVVFSTAAGPKEAVGKLKEILEPKGIIVSDKTFHCRGKFLFAHRNHPNEEDLKEVSEFAKGFLV